MNNFDAIGKLTTLLILKNNSSILEKLNYEYDVDGNQTRMVDYASNTTRYYYDALHRLTWEYRLGTHAYDYQYSYDSVGNRMTKISNGTETTYYAYNELNQLTSSTVGSQTTHYLYDTNGNMTYDDRGITIYPKQFTWNQKNQLTQFTYTGSPQVFKYQYDVEGRKVFYNQNFSGGKQYRYLYDGNRVLQENEPHPMSGWNLGGRPVAVYTLAPGDVGNIISVRRSTTDYFYHYDRMGNVLFLTDTAGNKAVEYVMEGFGNTIYSSGSVTDNHRLSTKEYDSNSGLYYFMARWYYPQTGNFISKDPIPSINPYPYCGQNPNNRIDPLGLKWGNYDFFEWYFWGNGYPVSLNDRYVDLIDDFKNAPDIKAIRSKNRVDVESLVRSYFQELKIGEERTINIKTRKFQYNVEETIRVLGNGSVYADGKCRLKKECKTGGECLSGSCSTKFSVKDRFEDPFDYFDWFKKDWEMGTPYTITGYFYDAFYFEYYH